MASLEKRPDRKREKPHSTRIDQGQVYCLSRTRMGGWAVAPRSPILGTTITIERLKRGVILV